jgi:chromosome segregation ATPase
MALSDKFTNSRGLDAHAMSVLDSRKKNRDNRGNDLKRKHAEREINSLRSKLDVINREIQRLAVSGRRFHGDEARTKTEFEQESRALDDITKELGIHSEKIRELDRVLSAKRMVSEKVHKSDFGQESAKKEIQRLKVELNHATRDVEQLNAKKRLLDQEIAHLNNEKKSVDQEIEQLDPHKRRLMNEIRTTEDKIQQAAELEIKSSHDSLLVEREVDKVSEELRSEQSMFSRLKARFSNQHRSFLSKKKQMEEVDKRMKGASEGSPALENEKMKIEQQIRNLEKDLN